MFRAGTSPVGIALAEIGRRGPEGSELLPDVLALLRDEDQSTTLIWQVLPVLSAMNTAARPAGPRLRQLFETLQKVERLNQRDSSLRIAETMFDVGGDTDELVDLLIAALRNSESPARHDTARLLCRVSPASALEEAHRIISCLADDKAPVNVRDLFTLEGLAPFASEAVPLLIKLVDDPNKSVSGAAIRTLGEIGPKAAPAVSMFTAMLDVKPGYTRGPTDILVVNALGKIGPAAAPAVPALVNMLGAPDATIAADTLFGGSPHYGSAIAALKRIGDGNPAVLQALRLHFANKSPAVGAAAIDAFAQLDTDPDQVLSVLEQQLRVEDPAIRIAAIGALASRLADSKMVLTLLLQQLDHRDANLRARAILAISRLPGRVGVAIPALTSALSDENPYVRSAAALALGQIGPQAESAVPILKTMLHEPANWVRNSRYWPVGERYPVVSFYIPQLADISIRGAARSALAQIEE